MKVEEIQRSAANGQLIVILGAGASMALMRGSGKALSWIGLVKSGLDYGRERKRINDDQHAHYLKALDSEDIDDLLGVAEFVGRKLQSPNGDAYARWMAQVFESWKPESGAMANALRNIAARNIPIASLNYDTLVENSIKLTAIDFADTEAMMAWVRKEREGVLHLHGYWRNPKNCVFSIRDYNSTLSDDVRLTIQRWLAATNRLLFIGCGDTFADPNFSGLIQWLRNNLGANTPLHCALVHNNEVPKRLADSAWSGFVEPLGYGNDHVDLPGFLLTCFPTRSPRGRKRTGIKREAEERYAHLIDSYRNFLLRDCGAMTIEGLRADMDTAQRKFDLEKLFVPLEVLPFPPIIALTDPDRETKLSEWRKENATPVPFAHAFEKHKKIALLALPGGGKTLLLKRLAVAYADPPRRQSSNDNLPALDLLPVMIRCREWKEHIRQPISILLRSLATITGDNTLEGLVDALEKPLNDGAVLLLVDGLDEIHNDADRSIFVENLEKFLGTYNKIRLLVTSREAGFDLVAPCLVRFCEKFGIAPLNESAIEALCGYWHRLMSGSTPEAIAEGQVVTRNLLSSDSLRRLAENPLLLTMLLVVKHGAGRLPPDRVSLYDRAVEVLVDTWNIRGHEPLNVKEAVPQLACVAFELLRRGKQTVTESEFLNILEDARAQLPIIGRYAKDSPHAFLKRVELRSSLMLEGGHTSEDGKTVPFYQFRHLTFQEYLAAVAAVNGYILSADGNSLPLSALRDNLLSEEWKEVIPMAAVLARNQAEPLLEALVDAAELERASLDDATPRKQFRIRRENLPPATSRLTQAMVEEAIFAPHTLTKATKIIVALAQGCQTNDNWQGLSRGPYGPDLRSAALERYLTGGRPSEWDRNTVALLEAHSESADFWKDKNSENVLLERLKDHTTKNYARAMLSIAGAFWLHRDETFIIRSREIYNALEIAIFDDRLHIKWAGGWCWGFWRYLQKDRSGNKPTPSIDTFKRLVDFFCDENLETRRLGQLLINGLDGIGRNYYNVSLSVAQDECIRSGMEAGIQKIDVNIEDDYYNESLVRIAFLLNGMFSDEFIEKFIDRNKLTRRHLPQDISSYLKKRVPAQRMAVQKRGKRPRPLRRP